MNRRSLLGFLGGAVATGPKLAQGLAEQVVTAGAFPTPGVSLRSGSVAAPEWRAEQITRLKNLISRGPSKEDRMRQRLNAAYQLESQERFRLDSLRAVSPSHKMRMLIDGNQTRQDRIQRLDAEIDLDRLLNPGNW